MKKQIPTRKCKLESCPNTFTPPQYNKHKEFCCREHAAIYNGKLNKVRPAARNKLKVGFKRGPVSYRDSGL